MGFEVDFLLDELYTPVDNPKKGKKAKKEGPVAVQQSTVFKNWAKYMVHQARPEDALNVVRANLIRSVADVFR